MEEITLQTQSHPETLEQLLSSLPDGMAAVSPGPLFTLRLPRTALNGEALAQQLAYIHLQQHPIFRHSPKLDDIARQLRQTEIHRAHTQKLSRYLDTHPTLNLEGYATFCMADYHHKLDLIAYCIVKRMRRAL